MRKTGKRTLPPAFLDYDAAAGVAYASHGQERTHHGETTAIKVELIDSQIPAWPRVVPSKVAAPDSRALFGFNPDYAERFSVGTSGPIWFCNSDEPGNPVLVVNKNRPEFFGVIMPMHTWAPGETPHHTIGNSWLRNHLKLDATESQTTAAAA